MAYEQRPNTGSLFPHKIKDGSDPEKQPALSGSNLIVECPHCGQTSNWFTSLFKNMSDKGPWFKLSLRLKEEARPGGYNQSRSKPQYNTYDRDDPLSF